MIAIRNLSRQLKGDLNISTKVYNDYFEIGGLYDDDIYDIYQHEDILVETEFEDDRYIEDYFAHILENQIRLEFELKEATIN